MVASSNAASGQTVIGNYYDAENQAWHLVEIRPSSGEVKGIGHLNGLSSLASNANNSFVVDGMQNKVHFFGYDTSGFFRFYTVSSIDAEILSSPVIEEDGWFGLTFNPTDSILYVSKGVYDGLGTKIIKFANVETGYYEYVQHIDLECVGVGAISNQNILITQAVEYTSGIPDGQYYAVNLDINDSNQSFNVTCDYTSPAFILDLRYHPINDLFLGLKLKNDNTMDFISFNPPTGETHLIGDLTGFERSNVGGGILFNAGYYIFTGTYTGDTIQRVFSVDIETGEVVNDPALSLQVQIRGIDVDQNSLVGIAEASEAAKAIKVFPNPAREMIHFEVNSRAEFQVMDVLGKVLIQGNAKSDQQADVDVSGLAAGVYYLRTENSAASFVVGR